MPQETELWMAYGTNKFTVYAATRCQARSIELKLKFSGHPGKWRFLVESLIFDYIEQSTFDKALVDVEDVDFFNGFSIDDDAIDLLVSVAEYFAENSVQTKMLLPDGVIHETFEQAFSGLFAVSRG